MHSPLDAFPSERSGLTSKPRPKVPAAAAQGEGQWRALAPPSGPIVRVARWATSMGQSFASSFHAISARAIGAEREARWSARVRAAGRAIAAKGSPAAAAGVSAAATALAACRRFATRWSAGLRKHSLATPAWVHDDRTSVIVTAAFTSACVSLLTMWLWGQDGPGQTEPLAAASQPQVVASESSAAAFELPVRTSEPGAGVSEPRAATPQPRPLLETPAPKPPKPAPVTVRPPATATARASTAVPRPAKAPAASTQAGSAGGASRLVIITEPEGASVTINGVGWGTTPLTIRYLPPGTKRIRVTRSGYQSAERVVNVGDARAPATLRIALREAPEARRVR